MNDSPSFPWEVEWSITWSCNARCFFCSTGLYNRTLHAENVDLVAERIVAAKPLTVTLSGGEPLLHPRIEGVIDIFLSNKIPLNLTTNGLAISRLSPNQMSALNWARISIHSSSDSNSKRIMGENYSIQKVFRNIETLKKFTNKFSIFMLLTTENSSAHEIQKLIKSASDLGATRVEIGILKLLGWAKSEMLIEKNKLNNLLSYAIETANSNGLEITTPEINQERHNCSARTRNAAIFPDGSVRSCSFDKDEQWGNILLEPLGEIWERRARLDRYCDRCAPGGYLNDSAQKIIPTTPI